MNFAVVITTDSLETHIKEYESLEDDIDEALAMIKEGLLLFPGKMLNVQIAPDVEANHGLN